MSIHYYSEMSSRLHMWQIDRPGHNVELPLLLLLLSAQHAYFSRDHSSSGQVYHISAREQPLGRQLLLHDVVQSARCPSCRPINSVTALNWWKSNYTWQRPIQYKNHHLCNATSSSQFSFIILDSIHSETNGRVGHEGGGEMKAGGWSIIPSLTVKRKRIYIAPLLKYLTPVWFKLTKTITKSGNNEKVHILVNCNYNYNEKVEKNYNYN